MSIRKLSMLALTIAATPVWAQQPARAGDNQTITVTGRRIAEVEFEAGDFAQARSDIATSLGRNRG